MTLDHPEEETGAVAGEPRDSERVDVGAQVNAIVEAAESKAGTIEHDIEQRREALQREVKMLEERKQRVMESLRDVMAQLQDAIAEPVPEQESLVDALDVERRS